MTTDYTEPDRYARLNAWTIGLLVAGVVMLFISQAQTYRDMRQLQDNAFHAAVKADGIKRDLDRITNLAADRIIDAGSSRVGPAPASDSAVVRRETFDRRPSEGGTR